MSSYFETAYRKACRATCQAYKDFLKTNDLPPLVAKLGAEKRALAEFVTGIPIQDDLKYRTEIPKTKDTRSAMQIRAEVMAEFGMDTTAIEQLISSRSKPSDKPAVLPGLEDWGDGNDR